MIKFRSHRLVEFSCLFVLIGYNGICSCIGFTSASADPMIKWIRANEGFFSEKVEFRHVDPKDVSSPFGLFAKEALKHEEKIMIIPQKCLLTSGGSEQVCDTAWNLIEQHKLGDKSFHKEYVSHIFDDKHRRKIPEAWSPEAKHILATIHGSELDPEVPERSFKKDCEGSGDAIEEDAYDLVISRGWNDVLIPIYDMVNHRNGHWHNSEATTAHSDEDVTVYAFRDIEEGEQIHLSYNDCLVSDCEGLFHEYGTQQILMDYGIVEDYPQRFLLEMDGFEQETVSFILELDQAVTTDPYDSSQNRTDLRVKWYTDVRPDYQIVNNMWNQLKRLRDLDEFITTKVEALSSVHESRVITDYHLSLKLALQQGVLTAIENDKAEKTGTSSYDILEKRPSKSESEAVLEPYTCHVSKMMIGGRGYVPWDSVVSQYQEIAFKYNEKLDDTCLWLSGWAQTCTSFRQYHEALVHYPATFVKEVKRVAFIGGGDNMILHEILKYDSLELALGMELDQQVLRSSFKNLGTLPYFDDSRVQWWFGDATKSLLMLPEEYFGTFDLMFVDLQTFVADALKVTPDLSVMDTLKLLLKPDGIIAKNEDFPNRQVIDFAKYTVDLEYEDLPALCRQSITIGSDGIDLLRAKHYDHGVDTIYLKKSLKEATRFNDWYNFRHNVRSNDGEDSTSDCSKGKEPPPEGTPATPMSQKYGVFVVIEADDLDGTMKTRDSAIEALKKAATSFGLNVLAVSDSKKKPDVAWYDVVVILREGYISLRKRSFDGHAALDVLLWDSVDNMSALKATLLTNIGGNEQSGTSYRFVVGGMTGVSEDPYAWQLVRQDMTCDSSDILSTDAAIKADVALIYQEMIKLIPYNNPSVIVICGDELKKCTMFEALKNLGDSVIPISTCANIASGSSLAEETALFACEVEIMRKIKSMSSKVNGILVDQTAARPMAQIVLKALTSQIGKLDYLEEDHVVVTQIVPHEEWREAFLERFHTDVWPFFDPAKEARMICKDDAEGSTEIGIFSSGDKMFYSNLVNLVETINKDEVLEVSIQEVKSGYANYVPDFSPEFFSNAAYDKTRSSKQWSSQSPVGVQTLFQFQLEAPKRPLKVGDKVLYRYVDEVWVGKWIDATVTKVLDGDLYNLVDARNKKRRKIARSFIRPLHDSAFTSKLGERILIRRGKRGYIWRQGILSKAQGEDNFQVRVFDGDGTTVNNVPKKDFISQFEGGLEEDLPSLSTDQLEKLLKGSLQSDEEKSINDLMYDSYKIGDGCVLVAFWDMGNVILSWDGMKHIDINLYVDDKEAGMVADTLEKMFLGNIPYLGRIARDEQPRGSGGVVNFATDIDQDPYWFEK
mmetsp:Transcript_15556/g.23887  ORF Transcript_15556/g.23887 Transcript_15556/m.23887 type:complete len:1342 (-) Transcript_15556:210-4235(-)|eukprot:CAMPEP_0194235182 /NCGR_PEP_ID=MMETSP0158-20130606/2744_1 /TAXON_ID=33649 /ORGANISM="Thalassionema nitzschioides, Strain L26-B" /LENGTH=1341 /DNA_ID=CAMNT_0038968591 /DNA_START=112 /DNA_END=4137 /DNA_ORIENTATION=+